MKMSCTLGADAWDPNKFWLVRNSQWLNSVKRGLRLRGIGYGDRLFIYVARDSGNAVLAYWVKERPGGMVKAFVTLCNITHGLPTLDYLAARIRPAREQAKEGLKALHEEWYAEKQEEARQEDAKIEWLKFIRKKDPQLARLVEMGKIPVSFERNELVKEKLMEAARRVQPKPTVVKYEP